MKKKILLLPLLVASIVGCFANPLSVKGYTLDDEQNMEYSIAADHLVYKQERSFNKTVNTFEAWIKLPEDLADEVPGGIIMGNFFNTANGYPGCINFNIAREGKFHLIWNWKNIVSNKSVFEYEYIFENYDFRTGKWEHLSFVRDNSSQTLTLYVNGVEVEKVTGVILSEAHNIMPYQIGFDYTNWYVDIYGRKQSPFMGEIKQVTLFETSRTENQIKDDMTKENITSETGLLSNYVFYKNGKSIWGNYKNVVDTCATNRNDLILTSFNKYVEAEEYNDFDYSFAIIPDMQAMNVAGFNKRYLWTQQSEWLVANKTKEKIGCTLYMGDMTEQRYTADPVQSEEEWQFAQSAIRILDDEIPYGFVPGNHDYDSWLRENRNATLMNKYFPYSYYSDKTKFPYNCEFFEEGNIVNYYMKLEILNVKYAIFCIEEAPRDIVLNWMDRKMSELYDHRIIYTTHSYLTPQGLFSNEENSMHAPSKTITYGSCNNADMVWDKCLKYHENLFMIFCGHECTDDLVLKDDIGVYGNKVRAVLVDNQGSDGTSCMNSFLLLRVNEAKKVMHFSLYSPEYDAVFNIQNQFELSFDDVNNPNVGGKK